MTTEKSDPPTTTHVVMLIDMSGSMKELADDVAGGFNTYIEDLRNDGDYYRLTVTVFRTTQENLVLDQPIDDRLAFRLSRANYRPDGMTALNDAVGRTLSAFDEAHGPLLAHERALLVIQTDGQENASRQWDAGQVKALLQERAARSGWGVIYLAAGLEAFEQAQTYGVGSNTVMVGRTRASTRSTYSGLTTGTRSFASGQSVQRSVEDIAGTEGINDDEGESA